MKIKSLALIVVGLAALSALIREHLDGDPLLVQAGGFAIIPLTI